MRKFLSGCALLFPMVLSSLAQASWVGVWLYTPDNSPSWGARWFGSDHIHMSVSDDEMINTRTMNIWGWGGGEVTSELHRAGKFILFHTDIPKDEIEAEWSRFYHQIVYVAQNRSILSQNCADASEHMMNFLLEKRLHKRMNFARLIGHLKIPNIFSPIRLPRSVYKQIETTLTEEHVPYVTHRTVRAQLGKNVSKIPANFNYLPFLTQLKNAVASPDIENKIFDLPR